MSFFAELMRRNVIRVGVAYAVVAWVLAQIAEFAFENFGAPDWVLKSVVVILLLGLPLALFFAWAFEMTPEGIKREADVDRSKSITTQTGRKLDYVIIAVLVVALGWFAWDKFGNTDSVPEVTTAKAQRENAYEAATEKSVAVLPFVAMSRGPDDEYFADGLTEEILNSLAQLPELLVTARTSAFSFKGQDIPVQEIATALGVRHIVEGSVRRSGDRLRVTAQLIRADDGFHLWSENYDSTSTDTISVQEDIAEQIAAALDVILDEKKREAMRQAGLRDVEAFTIYQKAHELYERAHGETDHIEGLQQANVLFEKVIERVPDFSPVYIDHSDLFVHILSDSTYGSQFESLTKEEVANAYPTAIADYEAAERYSTDVEFRPVIQLDLAYISGDWQGLAGRIERALNAPGCRGGNWTPIVAEAFGYSAMYLPRAYRILQCDPRRSLSWFNTARTLLKTGATEEALRVAREGSEIAPGAWLDTILVRALVASGQHDEARKEIDERIRDAQVALYLKAMVAAHEGDRARFDRELDKLKGEEDPYGFWVIMAEAWGGNREEVNRLAAGIDNYEFGLVPLTQVIQWCDCGAPWDLEVTPNFAAKLEGSGLTWPPKAAMEFPLKDW